MIRFIPDLLVLGGNIEISWTRQPYANFFIVLAHYEPVLLKEILVNVTYDEDGLSQPFSVPLPQVPAINGYVLQATNVQNLHEIWDQSEAFSINDPTSISTSASNGPTTIYYTTTITAAPSTSLGSSITSSAITTSLSQSISTPSSSSPTNNVSSTLSVSDTVTLSPTASQTSDSEKSIPLGSIIGGILGGLVLILLLGVALVFARMRHKKRRRTDQEDPSVVDPKVHAAFTVTPYPIVPLTRDLTLDNSSLHSHRTFPSNSEPYNHTNYAMGGIPRALTPGITSHTSPSLHSQTGFQPPKSSMHETASIGGTSIVSSQPFTNPTGRPSTPSVPFTGSRSAQHSPHVSVDHSPVSLQERSATPGPSTGASSNAQQQPWKPLMVVGGTSCDIDDELPPPSYTSGILTAPVREK